MPAPPKLVGPHDLSPEALRYISEWSTLNQPPITSGQVVGAESYTRRIYTVATQQVVQASTTEATIFTYQLGGGTLGTQGGVRIFILGTYLNSTGSASDFTLRFNYGATEMYEGVDGRSSQANRSPFVFDLYLSGAGSTTSQLLHGMILSGSRSAAPATGLGPLSSASEVFTIYGTASENSTLNKPITISIQHSVNNANVSFHRNHAVLSKYGH